MFRQCAGQPLVIIVRTEPRTLTPLVWAGDLDLKHTHRNRQMSNLHRAQLSVFQRNLLLSNAHTNTAYNADVFS